MPGCGVDAEFGAADGCAEGIFAIYVVERGEIGNPSGGETEGDIEVTAIVQGGHADQAAIGRAGDTGGGALHGERLCRGAILYAAAVRYCIGLDEHLHHAVAVDPELLRVDVVAVDPVLEIRGHANRIDHGRWRTRDALPAQFDIGIVREVGNRVGAATRQLDRRRQRDVDVARTGGRKERRVDCRAGDGGLYPYGADTCRGFADEGP